MSLQLKPTVRLGSLRPQLLLALAVAEGIWRDLGLPMVTITSGNDSQHGGQPVAGEARDPHYTGRALDLRLNDIPAPETRQRCCERLSVALGPSFRVLHESAGTPNEHCHVQYEGDA